MTPIFLSFTNLIFADPNIFQLILTLPALFSNAAASTEAAECESGEVRLANFTDDPDEATREGTMQICINNAWGAVCSDDPFDTTDAEVFCDELMGFQRDG